jgi:hypothetical protein
VVIDKETGQKIAAEVVGMKSETGQKMVAGKGVAVNRKTGKKTVATKKLAVKNGKDKVINS